MKRLDLAGRTWLRVRARNQARRLAHRVDLPRVTSVREPVLSRVFIWQGGEPEVALCTGHSLKPLRRLSFDEDLRGSAQFFDQIRKASHASSLAGLKLVDRSRKIPRVSGYVDFSYPEYVSTAAAVVLAAEYERIGAIYGEIPHTVDLHRWNADVFRKLYQIGFFEIVGITPQRDDVIIDHGDTRTMQIVSTKNADDLEKVDRALQELGAFLGPGGVPDEVIIELLTGLSEAISNVTNHGYPDDFNPPFRHIGRLWVAATADRAKHSLTVVVYDQGVTIPVTYPRVQRLEQVMKYLGRTLSREPAFEFQNDGTYIRAAMRHGGSRTDQRHRGKGLPQIVDALRRSGSGSLSVYSRGGWCKRDVSGRFHSGAIPISIGGTLIEWTVELNASL